MISIEKEIVISHFSATKLIYPTIRINSSKSDNLKMIQNMFKIKIMARITKDFGISSNKMRLILNNILLRSLFFQKISKYIIDLTFNNNLISLLE